MFPASWNALENGRTGGNKRPKTFMDTMDECIAENRKDRNDEPIEFISSIQHTISKKLSESSHIDRQEEMDLDHILSRVPYRVMLENLFGNITTPEIPDLPIISKAYEENFMRQPMAGEQPCAMGEQCECRYE